MGDRLDYKLVGLAILFLLCWMGFSPLACSGAVVWSDDFNEPAVVFENWTIVVNENLYDGIWGFSGSDWSADNYYLQLDQSDWGVISHPSDVAYGTWSFDFKVNETQVVAPHIAFFQFISNDLLPLDHENEIVSYYIDFRTVSIPGGYDGRFHLEKQIGGVETIIAISEATTPIAGWHHIDVTRTEEGLFSVYHNDALIMQETDTDIATSEVFWLWLVFEGIIDNVVVDNEVRPPPNWVLFAIIGGAAVVIVAVLVIFLRRR